MASDEEIMVAAVATAVIAVVSVVVEAAEVETMAGVTFPPWY